MKELINFCPLPGFDSLFDAYPERLDGFLRDNALDGIELQVLGRTPYASGDFSPTVGVHLRHWPYWLDFWLEDTEELNQNHTDAASMASYFLGAETPEQWLDVIRDNIKAALAYEPEYLVWHVSHCGLGESYDRAFRYSSEQVIDGTVEVFNLVKDGIPAHVTVLFENLWWSGLTLTDPVLTDRLFRGVRHSNIGLIVDTGHLMNCQQALTSEKEAVHFLRRTLDGMGEYRNAIQGVHLSCSLSGAYQKACATRRPTVFNMPDIFKHITQIDQHKAFREAPLQALLSDLSPQYLVHELFYSTLPELSGYLKQHRTLMQR